MNSVVHNCETFNPWANARMEIRESRTIYNYKIILCKIASESTEWRKSYSAIFWLETIKRRFLYLKWKHKFLNITSVNATAWRLNRQVCSRKDSLFIINGWNGRWCDFSRHGIPFSYSYAQAKHLTISLKKVTVLVIIIARLAYSSLVR